MNTPVRGLGACALLAVPALAAQDESVAQVVKLWGELEKAVTLDPKP